MQITVIRFDATPFSEALKRKELGIFKYITNDTFIKIVVLSILHRHCVLMLTDGAADLYESISIDIRNRIDDIVEELVFDSLCETPYYLDFLRMLKGVYSIQRINIRNKNTIEVYSGNI